MAFLSLILSLNLINRLFGRFIYSVIAQTVPSQSKQQNLVVKFQLDVAMSFHFHFLIKNIKY